MLPHVYEGLKQILGLDLKPDELSALQICLRATLVFIFAMVLVRFAAKRFLARLTALDAILGFVLASTLSRAINGSAPFFPTLAASIILIILHRIFAWLSMFSHTFGNWVKGTEDVLIENGEARLELMKKHCITQEDLLEELRLNGNIGSAREAGRATLERSGQISVIKAKE